MPMYLPPSHVPILARSLNEFSIVGDSGDALTRTSTREDEFIIFRPLDVR